jgi:serine protease Do
MPLKPYFKPFNILTFAKFFVIKNPFLYLIYERKRRQLKYINMQKAIHMKFVTLALALAVLPGLGWAQEQKDKKEKEKGMQTIVITRNSEASGKTVIEIDGDKVTVNGKDAKDNKDVTVNVNTIKNGKMRFSNSQGGSWTMALDEDRVSLFDEDENRAMLGVVTEGDDKGAEIKSITKESAAEKAGLKKGDIITHIGDKKIETTDDVTEAIRSRKPGEKVNITYLRDNKEQKISAELGKWKGIRMNAVSMPRVPRMPDMHELERLENFNFENMAPSVNWNMGRPKLGVSIQDTDDGKGVKILEVDEESNAAKAGLKKDDIVLAIDGKDVTSTSDITRTMRENREKVTFNFKISRGGKTQDVEVKMPKKLKTADL